MTSGFPTRCAVYGAGLFTVGAVGGFWISMIKPHPLSDYRVMLAGERNRTQAGAEVE